MQNSPTSLSSGKQQKVGCVYLVGAGPGDPGLLTLRGAKLISEADVVFYDYLANEKLLEHAPPEAQKIFVGKKGLHGGMTQSEIEKAVIREAKKGHSVVRLKGGDPFIFGRGGEEALALKKADIPFEIVPGVTSAVAVPAYAGIPLTHRNFASEVVFVTGHGDPARDEYLEDPEHEGRMGNIPWEALAKMGTVVFLMGTMNLRTIMQRLVAYGRSGATPAAVISFGTYPHQKTVTATVSTIADEAQKAGITPPTVIVAGEVVSLRNELKWFESRPLFGKKILLTRSQEQLSELAEIFSSRGGSVMEFPTIRIVPPDSFDSLDLAVKNIRQYQWLIFTSANGVKFFMERLKEKGKDIRALAHLKIGAIGRATAGKAGDYGLWVDLVPEEFHAEGLLCALRESGIRGKRVLIPRAGKGRQVLASGLKKLKCRVDVATAYENILPDVKTYDLENIFFKIKPDWVVFASSSTVKNFVEILGRKNLETYLQGVKIACIGPITRTTAKKCGLRVNVMPEESSMPALVDAVCKNV